MAIIHFRYDFVAYVKKDPKSGSYVLDYGVSLEHSHSVAGVDADAGGTADGHEASDVSVSGHRSRSIEMTESTWNPLSSSVRSMSAGSGKTTSLDSRKLSGSNSDVASETYAEDESEEHLFTESDLHAIFRQLHSSEEEVEENDRSEETQQFEDLKVKLDQQVNKHCRQFLVLVYK